ncbi:hypothetical protein BGW36DRAFT_260035, partial [Talaromyces proteolyticus]
TTNRGKRKRQSEFLDAESLLPSFDTRIPSPNDELSNRQMALDPWQFGLLVEEASSMVGGTGNSDSVKTAQGSLSRYLPYSVPLSGDVSYLAGDVYQLRANDVIVAALSGLIAGPIYLTDPYYQNISPFINMPITDNLKKQFIKWRHRVM